MLMSLLVYVAYQNGGFVLLSAGMTGALLGFLCFNFPPARIYLGDGGAYFLGFQVGLFSILNSHKGTVVVALIAPLFVLALPIVDTALAILRRGLRGLPVFRPDQSHIHHHLLEMGMSRRRVVLSLYGVTLVFLVMGFAAFWSRGNLVPGLLGLALLLLLLCAGKLSFTREWLAVSRTLGNSLAMRRQIQYALSLTNWIRCEGQRSGSLEDLFTDLAFAARRLGFTSASLTLTDGRRGWSHPQACKCFRSSHHELVEGSSGVLDLQAPICQFKGKAPVRSKGRQHSCPMPLCGDVRDARLYQIMADLLAESWLEATGKWRTQGPLRFDMLPPELTATYRGGRLSVSRHSRQPQEKSLPVLTRESVAG
jgi:UDP-GlcNAc:undecaprenyl-phosphate GlcNAc-1-phosphate transferase